MAATAALASAAPNDPAFATGTESELVVVGDCAVEGFGMQLQG